MTINVSGGTAAIANAEIISGPCSYLLIHSAGEAGAQHSYAATQITYTGPSDTPPPCMIRLTSLYGDSAMVTASLSTTDYEKPCCPTGSCCAQTGTTTLHQRVVFDQPTQTISFPIPSGLDGGADDAALDAEGNLGDAETYDSTEDTPENIVEDAAINGTSQSAVDTEQALDLANVS